MDMGTIRREGSRCKREPSETLRSGLTDEAGWEVGYRLVDSLSVVQHGRGEEPFQHHRMLRSFKIKSGSPGNRRDEPSEIPCRVSSDLHEWCNDLTAVSTKSSAKLKQR